VFSSTDTIVAIATPPGRGGIGVVRISGPLAIDVALQLARRTSLEPRRATLTTVSDSRGTALDRAVVTAFRAPHSYTGEDVAEISAHGSPPVLQAILRAAMDYGARLANPGEFTFRAYLHGRVDLVQAEAIGALIESVTPLQARVAFDQLEGTLTARLRQIDDLLLDVIARLEASLDFPDEGYHFIADGEAPRDIARILAAVDVLLADAARGRVLREGLTAAILGRPNAGKSSLFNRLAGGPRAIVTDVPGTTRDLLTERIDIDGVPFTIVDTAGLRGAANDAIEEEGIARARQAAAAADVVILVLDRSRPLTDEDAAILRDTAAARRVIVASKSDLEPSWRAEDANARPVSSLTDDGIGPLRQALIAASGAGELRDRAAIANVRQQALLERIRTALGSAAAAAAAATPEEFVLADLRDARAHLDEISGARPDDEVLRTIFSRFCIGK
jgi:tRNA modification GTPase